MKALFLHAFPCIPLHESASSLLDGHDLPLALVGPAALHLSVGSLLQGVGVHVVPAVLEDAPDEDGVTVADDAPLLLDDRHLLPLAPGIVVPRPHGAAHDVHVDLGAVGDGEGHDNLDHVAALNLASSRLLNCQSVVSILLGAPGLDPLLPRSAIQLANVSACMGLDVNRVTVGNRRAARLLGSIEHHLAEPLPADARRFRDKLQGWRGWQPQGGRI
mmetsp:Transcript_41722/g.124633  ORF Transcript_41722/g.124633 Transcript_41722/m.124633 type:complete len:217 (+) Transcript_41722:1-651(+)